MKPKTRQKQKLKMRNLVLLSILFLSVSTMGLILFFQLNDPAISQAKIKSDVNIIIVKDQELLIDKSIDAPSLVDRPEVSQHTVFVKAVKRESQSAQN